jgi:glutathione synthase
MTIRIALQMDALSRLNLKYDSTLYLAKAALKRGCELFHYEPAHLRLDVGHGVTAAGHALNFNEAENSWSLGEAATIELADVSVVLMRQDPPFDLAYITATHLLDHLGDRVKVINDPTGVRNAPEKLLVTHFPQFMPPTLIARDVDAIEAFRVAHGDIVIKPIYGHAGHGIFHLRSGDDNLPGLMETLGGISAEPVIAQKFLPVNAYGDKRIVLLDGEAVGHYRRIPAKGDFRGNARVGARTEVAPLLKRDREICAELGPVLRDCGLRLVGLDVIGDFLTEINVTSPTGLVTSDELNNRSGKDSIAEKFWDKVLG